MSLQAQVALAPTSRVISDSSGTRWEYSYYVVPWDEVRARDLSYEQSGGGFSRSFSFMFTTYNQSFTYDAAWQVKADIKKYDATGKLVDEYVRVHQNQRTYLTVYIQAAWR